MSVSKSSILLAIQQFLENSTFPLHKGSPGDSPIAYGGDLSEWRLLDAYANGIFPWYNEESPILWWSPDPRFVLFPEKIRISRSMRQFIRKHNYAIELDQNFYGVLRACQAPRKYEQGTWITEEMLEAYMRLHYMGVAHSVEVKKEGKLVGGLYGVSLGKIFFGESMFSKESNTSKLALIYLAELLHKWNYSMIDCQVHTNHLESLGAEMIPRQKFIHLIKKGIRNEKSRIGPWHAYGEGSSLSRQI